MNNFTNSQKLQIAADQCVKCGVCLPHCPTYALRPEEAESPRGRISLLQGVVHGQLEMTQRVKQHLGNCLSCGRCEDVCPANVSYTLLMDGTRYLFKTTPEQQLPFRRRLAKLLSSPRLLGYVARSAQLAKALQLHKLLKKSLLARHLRAMPESITQAPSYAKVPDSETSLIQVQLFAGCLTNAFEFSIVGSAMRIGKHLGIAFRAPPKDICCGALYQHLGDYSEVQTLVKQAQDAFDHSRSQPVATLLSGCGKGLRENLISADNTQALALSRRLIDIHIVLNEQVSKITRSPFHPSVDRVALYLPCSVDTAQRAAIRGLLSKVPNLLLLEVGKGHGCCGASGDYMMLEPSEAQKFAQPLVDQIRAYNATHVLVPNLGCSWHLRSLVNANQPLVTIEHPLQWLARHLSV